jgi:hypothetical protein
MARPESTEPTGKPRPKRRKETGAPGDKRGRRPVKSAPGAAPPKARLRQDTKETARPRRALISGSALLLLGLAIVGVDSSEVGAGVTLIGLLILIYGIHSFGRLGPDEPQIPARAAD